MDNENETSPGTIIKDVSKQLSTEIILNLVTQITKQAQDNLSAADNVNRSETRTTVCGHADSRNFDKNNNNNNCLT